MTMSSQQTFNLAEATALLPKLKAMLSSANQELAAKAEALANAYVAYEQCEQEMNKVKPSPSAKPNITNDTASSFADLRQCRINFQAAIESLSQAKQNYMESLNFWFEEITDTGVILRDIKTGLLDFPARHDNFDYYLCWRLDEDEIRYWHLTNDGFVGRRPLAVLKEYV